MASLCNLPGDKSIAHRHLFFHSLTKGQKSISNLPGSEDVRATINVLEQLGCVATWRNLGELQLYSPGFEHFETNLELDCGNSGTTFRLLTGILSAHPRASYKIGCGKQLTERPQERLARLLRQCGADVRWLDKMYVESPRSANATLSIDVPVPSAQLKSALLYHAFLRQQELQIRIEDCRDHTERFLKSLGGELESFDDELIFRPGPIVWKQSSWVPGDLSSAAYWAVWASLKRGRQVELEKVSLNPTRSAWILVLKKMGADIEIEEEGVTDFGEPFGCIKVTYNGVLENGTLPQSMTVSMLDELPLLGMLATFSKGVQLISGADELRYKECNRIEATVQNAKRAGAQASETKDGWRIQGLDSYESLTRELHTAFQSYQDHRVAMSWSLARDCFQSAPEVDEVDCVSKSYPEFFSTRDQWEGA